MFAGSTGVRTRGIGVTGGVVQAVELHLEQARQDSSDGHWGGLTIADARLAQGTVRLGGNLCPDDHSRSNLLGRSLKARRRSLMVGQKAAFGELPGGLRGGGEGGGAFFKVGEDAEEEGV